MEKETALKILREFHDKALFSERTALETFIPELKESENDNMIMEGLIQYFNKFRLNTFAGLDPKKILSWLEKQNSNIDNANKEYWRGYREGKKEILDKYAELEKPGKHLENFDEAEKEKSDFVGDGFIECHANFLDFKEGNTYWLEYIGDDKYNVRSDNLLGKTYHITPCQLYTIFKKLTWLEQKPAEKAEPRFKVGDKIIEKDFDECGYGTITDIKDGKYIFDNGGSIHIEEQGLWQLVEPKFRVGYWVVDNCGYVWKIEGIINQFYILEGIDGSESRPTIEWVNKTFHLWTIADAKDGDVLQLGEVTAIFKEFIGNGNCRCYCSVCIDLFEVPSQDESYGCHNATPATKEQYDTLMKAMSDAGYTFDFDKKKLTPAWSEDDEKIRASMIEDYTEKVNSTFSVDLANYFNKCIDFLKNKNTWKPSDKQMGCLCEVLNHSTGNVYDGLKSLFDELQNLK